MSDGMLANFLILAMLLVGNARFLSASRSKKDTLAILPFLAFLLSIASVFAFDLSLENLVLLIFSLWCSIWNVRAILRLSSDLIIDRYDVKLKLICALNSLLTLALIAAAVYFLPMNYKKTKLPITQSTVLYSGNPQSGFVELKQPFVFPSVKLYSFEPKSLGNDNRTIVLFVTPETASSEIYSVFFQKLAHNGFCVYCVDVYEQLSFDDDVLNTDTALQFVRVLPRKIVALKWFTRFFAVRQNFFDRSEYEERIKANGCFEKKFDALLSLCDAKPSDRVFLLTEDDVSKALSTFSEKSPVKIAGTFDLCFIDEYETKGYGPVENTDPLSAFFLKTEPDRSGYMSNHLGAIVTEFIKSQSASPN